MTDSMLHEQARMMSAVEGQAACLAAQLQRALKAAQDREHARVVSANTEDKEAFAEVTARWFAVSHTLEEVILENEGHEQALAVGFQEMCSTMEMMEQSIAELGSQLQAETARLAAAKRKIADLEKEREEDKETDNQSVQEEREVRVRLEEAFESVHGQLRGLEGSVDALQLDAETRQDALSHSVQQAETAEHEMDEVLGGALEPLAHSVEVHLELLTVALQAAAEEREHARTLIASEAQARTRRLEQQVQKLALNERELEKALEVSTKRADELEKRAASLASKLAKATRALRVEESNHMVAYMHQASIDGLLQSLAVSVDAVDQRV